jgi:dTDP-glucose 4,6-dehydratase
MAETYTPKNILITGGAGFIASHVVIRFVKNYPQYNIVNFDKLDYCASLANLKSVADLPNYRFVKGDICQPDLVNYVIKEHQIDTIMHFAAQTHVDNAFGNSLMFTRNNVEGTHILLECAHAARPQIKRFIMVSSDEVYGETTDEALDEDGPLRPTQPYAATKAASEMMARAYYLSYNFPLIVTRGNNVYGPHQYPEKVIPKFINLLMRGKPLPIHGKGSAVRGFLFVEDVARAFDTICHKGKLGETYNIGTDFELTMNEVAHTLVEGWGYKGADIEANIQYGPDRPFNDCRYAIKSEKLTALGWKPEMSWEDGLKRTIEWYKENSGNWGNIDAALVAHPRIGMVPQPQTPQMEGRSSVTP